LAENEGYLVKGMAPTGAASKIMARESNVATHTVSVFNQIGTILSHCRHSIF